MSKFRIAVWAGQEGSPVHGGSYTYPAELISNIDNFNFDPDLEICFTGFSEKHNFKKPYILLNKEEHFVTRKITNFAHKFLNRKISLADNYEKKNHPANIEILIKHDVQLIFYPVNYVHYENFPFIVNNWDLGHASTYAFPEMLSTFKEREKYYYLLKKALFICAESEAGKRELISYLNLFPKRIKVLSFFPGGVVHKEVEVKKPDFLKQGEQFFFYPAAFGAHKNHYGLVQAFSKFHINNPQVKLVLTGGEYINKEYIRNLVTDLQLQDAVIFSGFLDTAVIKWLYINTLGLVMPTYLGPTNMPLLEAEALGCRIACSNLEGHKELLGVNAIYFNPENTEEIYQSLEKLYSLSEQKILPPTKTTYNITNTIKALNKIFLEAIPVRRTWGQ